jgi:hypothetical protein
LIVNLSFHSVGRQHHYHGVTPGLLHISPRYINTLQVTLIISHQVSYAAMSTHRGTSQAGSEGRSRSRFGKAELQSVVITSAARANSRGSQVGSQVQVTEEEQEPDSHETATVSLTASRLAHYSGVSSANDIAQTIQRQSLSELRVERSKTPTRACRIVHRESDFTSKAL